MKKVLDLVLCIFVMFVIAIVIATIVKAIGFTGFAFWCISLTLGTVIDTGIWICFRIEHGMKI